MANAEATAPPNGSAPEKQEAPEAKTHASLAEALVAAQAEMPAVGRDKENPHFKSKFTSLDNLLSSVRPVLNRHGLALVQTPMFDDEGKFVLRTRIMHTAGELAFDSPLTPTKDDPQGQGSAITYMRRYTVASALAIADQDDDDGNAASSGGSARPSASSTSPRNGQGDGQSSAATPAQRKKIIGRAAELGFAPYQTKAWLEFTAGTPHTDRIEKAKASELIDALVGFESIDDALAKFNAALENNDERAESIAAKHRPEGGS